MTLTLSIEKANRFCLFRHHLLEKVEDKALLRVVHDICGLNAQGAITVNLSLWNRIKTFDRRKLQEALYDKRILVKTWCMRGTVHIVPSKNLPVFHQALKNNLMKDWQHFLKRRQASLSHRKRRDIYQKILNSLSKKPLTRRELCKALGVKTRDNEIFVSRVLREMSYAGFLCHAKPLGPWYHFREYRFARLDKWLLKINLDSIETEDAKKQLLLWYLLSYGPATVQDFAYWAGYSVREAKRVFQITKGELNEVRIKGKKGKFWIHADDLETLDEVDVEAKPQACILPSFDPLIMGHKDKTHILNPEHKRRVFLPLANVAATILIGGKVVGTWRQRKQKKYLAVDVEMFERLTEVDMLVLRSKFEEMSLFLEMPEIRIKMKGI